MKRTEIFCQNCRKPNSYTDSHCAECGTRLLLVTFPNSLQYDVNHQPTFYEDHLLERVTLLELQLAQTVEKLDAAYSFIQKFVEATEGDHLLLKKFLQTISEPTAVSDAAINKRLAGGAAPDNIEKTNDILDEIKRLHDKPNAKLFTELIAEGLSLFKKNEEKQAFQMLERAALLSPRNSALLFFIGRQYFATDKYLKSSAYLEKAALYDAESAKTSLLLGALLADAGNLIESETKLKSLPALAETAFASLYLGGFIEAGRENWSKSAEFFTDARRLVNAPEIEYLIGSAQFNAGRFGFALDCYRNAVQIDEKYCDAWFMQSVTFGVTGDSAGENDALRQARNVKSGGAQCLEFLDGGKRRIEPGALCFAHLKKSGSRILTGGALRLTKFYKEFMLAVLEKL